MAIQATQNVDLRIIINSKLYPKLAMVCHGLSRWLNQPLLKNVLQMVPLPPILSNFQVKTSGWRWGSFWLPYQVLKSTWGDSAYFTPGIGEETNLSDSGWAPENRPFNVPQKGNKRIPTIHFQGKFAVGFREASHLSDHSFFSVIAFLRLVILHVKEPKAQPIIPRRYRMQVRIGISLQFRYSK